MPDPKYDIEDADDIEAILAEFNGGKPKPAAPTPVTPEEAAAQEAGDNFDDLLESVSPAVRPPPPPPPRPAAPIDDDGGLNPLAEMGLAEDRMVPNSTMPWMKYHDFQLVRTVEQVNSIVDDALAAKRCSIDLETEGLDNRIFYDDNGKPYTKHKIVGYCISVGDAKVGYYIPVQHAPSYGADPMNVTPLVEVEAAITRLCREAQPILKPDTKDPLGGKDFVTPPRVVIDFWHAAFDQEFLYPVTGIDFWHPDSFEDGNLACFVKFSADRHLGLKDKSKEMLRDPEGHPYEMIELKSLFPTRGRDIEFHRLSPEEPGVIKYACSDAICTRLLGDHKEILPIVKERYASTYRLEKQVTCVKRVMERNRTKLDRVRINELKTNHESALASIKAKIVSLAESKGFNGFEPSSPKQLGEFLFTEKGLDISPKPDKTQNGQFKTDWTTLEELTKELGEHAPPVLKWVIEYREEEKLIGTYLANMAANLGKTPQDLDEMRFQFKQTGAATGRFSAPAGDAEHGYSGIPIHGIPATSDLRTCFIARPGYTMLKCDYAGQELRIVTNLSNEGVWIKEFLEGDGDLHTITAMAFYNKAKGEVTKDERKGGKIANFALIYGGGPQAIMRATGCDKIEGARRKQAFDKSVPTFAGWVKGQHQKVKKDLGVWTAFARWIAIPDANLQPGGTDSNGRRADEALSKMVRASCERQATNYPIQGSGADIMKIAMVVVHKEFHKRGWLKVGGDDSCRMLLTVHDEIVFEIRHDRVIEAVPIIVDLMESPTKMARPPYSPPWRVPLITEPLVGPTWGTGYPCEKYKDTHKPKEGEVVAGGFVYGTVRVVDMNKDGSPKDMPVAGETILKYDKEKKKVSIKYVDPEWLQNVGAVSEPYTPPKDPNGGGEGSSTPPAGGGAPPAAPVAPPRVADVKPKTNGVVKTATIKLKMLSKGSVKQVRALACMCIEPEHGDLLQVIDPMTDKVIVDPKLGIRVDSARLAQLMLGWNLSDGRVAHT
jgi:DNA polymerase I-like protein with 3'-5' exonuclease and polymerase domains